MHACVCRCCDGITGGKTEGLHSAQRVQISFIAVDPSTGDVVYDSFADDLIRLELETRLTQLQPVEILLPVQRVSVLAAVEEEEEGEGQTAAGGHEKPLETGSGRRKRPLCEEEDLHSGAVPDEAEGGWLQLPKRVNETQRDLLSKHTLRMLRLVRGKVVLEGCVVVYVCL